MWQEIQSITDYKPKRPVAVMPSCLMRWMTFIYALRHKTKNLARKTTLLPNEQVLRLSGADIWKTLHNVNPQKATGPDNIPGARRMGRPTGRCPDWCLQHIPEHSSGSYLPQNHQNYPSAQEVNGVLPQQLPAHSTQTHHHQVFWEVGMRHMKSQLPKQQNPPQYASIPYNRWCQ